MEIGFGERMLFQVLQCQRHQIGKAVPLSNQESKVLEPQPLRRHTSKPVALLYYVRVERRLAPVVCFELLKALVASRPVTDSRRKRRELRREYELVR
jgi:hypothetical protein